MLGPELSKSNLKRLLIVPDGNLSYIPFESLLTIQVGQQIRDYSNLPYLLNDYAVSYSPSVSIMLASQNSNNSNHRYLGFAPNYADEVYSDVRQKLSSLQYNEPEVEFAADLFNGKSWTGSSVTEETLKSNVSNAGILHLAMHGEVEDEHPLLSKLFFNNSSENDGILHTYEIYNMTIPAQLVILSACNTAKGKWLRGEGILSLERAFQYAGSNSLVSTLWTVDDAASAKLTQAFLQNIKDGQTKDIALQQAKLQYIQNATSENLHPFYWSSFKLTGNTKPLEGSSLNNYLYFGLGMCALIFFAVVYFRKTKKAT